MLHLSYPENPIMLLGNLTMISLCWSILLTAQYRYSVKAKVRRSVVLLLWIENTKTFSFLVFQTLNPHFHCRIYYNTMLVFYSRKWDTANLGHHLALSCQQQMILKLANTVVKHTEVKWASGITFANMKENSLTLATIVEKATMQRETMTITSVCTRGGGMGVWNVKRSSG